MGRNIPPVPPPAAPWNARLTKVMDGILSSGVMGWTETIIQEWSEYNLPRWESSFSEVISHPTPSYVCLSIISFFKVILILKNIEVSLAIWTLAIQSLAKLRNQTDFAKSFINTQTFATGSPRLRNELDLDLTVPLSIWNLTVWTKQPSKFVLILQNINLLSLEDINYRSCTFFFMLLDSPNVHYLAIFFF